MPAGPRRGRARLATAGEHGAAAERGPPRAPRGRASMPRRAHRGRACAPRTRSPRSYTTGNVPQIALRILEKLPQEDT